MTTILIVEDNDMNLKLMESILSSNGFELLSAACGAEGVTLLENHSVDLILMDLQMPEMDGFQTLEAMHQLQNGSLPPVIAVTGNATDADRERCLASGFDDFIRKPYRIDTLLKVIQEQLL